MAAISEEYAASGEEMTASTEEVNGAMENIDTHTKELVEIATQLLEAIKVFQLK